MSKRNLTKVRLKSEEEKHQRGETQKKEKIYEKNDRMRSTFWPQVGGEFRERTAKTLPPGWKNGIDGPYVKKSLGVPCGLGKG